MACADRWRRPPTSQSRRLNAGCGRLCQAAAGCSMCVQQWRRGVCAPQARGAGAQAVAYAGSGRLVGVCAPRRLSGQKRRRCLVCAVVTGGRLCWGWAPGGAGLAHPGPCSPGRAAEGHDRANREAAVTIHVIVNAAVNAARRRRNHGNGRGPLPLHLARNQDPAGSTGVNRCKPQAAVTLRVPAAAASSAWTMHVLHQ